MWGVYCTWYNEFYKKDLSYTQAKDECDRLNDEIK